MMKKKKAKKTNPQPIKQALAVRSGALSRAFRGASPKDQLSIAMLHSAMERDLKALADTPDITPAEVAERQHEMADVLIQIEKDRHPRAIEISCRPGCAHCCHIEVSITAQEAALLARTAHDEGIEIDMQRARVQAEAEQWSDVPPELRACVFLNQHDGCKVYENRPLACRNYHVITSPDACDSIRHPGAEVINFVSVRSEILLSAARLATNNGRLADMVMRADP
jgi:Fe-S-cluster containining protein